MLKIAVKISIEFIPTPAFTRWMGLLILGLQWIGLL